MQQFINELDKSTVRRSFEVVAAVLILGALAAALSGLALGILFDIATGAATAALLFSAAAIFGGWRLALLLLDIQDNALNAKVAMIDKLKAEAEAIRSNGITQQNFHSKGHARVIVNNAPAINQQQEVVRLVPVHTPGRLVDGVSEADLADFISRIFVVGHSQRAMMGYKLPSGATIDTFEAYDSFIAPLVKSGIIVDRGERKKGRLSVDSPEQAKEILGLPAKSQVVTPG